MPIASRILQRTRPIVKSSKRIAALHLLYPAGSRPCSDSLRASLNETSRLSISHEPDDAEVRQGSKWVELLCDGLTFDLRGLAPGPPSAAVEIRHRFGLPGEFQTAALEWLTLMPGPHLQGGEATLPIVRGWMDVGHLLGSAIDGTAAYVWGPAGSAMSPDVFSRLVDAWLGGGAFPALGLTGFREEPDGSLRSDGLAFFTGQEFVIEGRLAADKVLATQLGARIVNEMVASGPIGKAEQFSGLDGATIVIEPTEDAAVLRVHSS